jgi:formiminotetrahydrofolate cyclodeaminase
MEKHIPLYMKNPKNGTELVLVPDGWFWMGSGDEDNDAANNEKPRHLHYVDPFYIAIACITVAQFKRFVDETGYKGGKYPGTGYGWDERWEEFSDWAEKGQYYKDALVNMVDEDTNAFNKIMDAFGLPKGSDEEKAARTQAIQDATKYATEVPFKVMQLCYDSMEVIKAMAEIGNPNSVTDAGVGALAARSGVMGAFLNVKINASGLKDRTFADKILKDGQELQDKTIALEKEILDIVNGKI